MKVYFSLGTNLGDKERNLRLAVQKIEADRESGFPVRFLCYCPLGIFLREYVLECGSMCRDLSFTIIRASSYTRNRAGDRPRP